MRCQNILSGPSLGPGPEGTTRVAVGRAELLVPGTSDAQVKFTVRPENLRLRRTDAASDDRHGVAVAVETDLGIPVKYIGVGETVDDLLPFEPAAFADALLGG